jgi:glutathione S-transferase
MPDIRLFEPGPTRSAGARWALLEAGLSFESIGNDISILGSDALRAVHPPGSRSRYLHYQWLSFTLSELEAFLQSTEVNSIDFIIPESEHVPGIIEQNNRFLRKGAAVLNDVLGTTDYLIDNRFSVADIFVGYTVNWAQEQGLLGNFPNLIDYQARLLERPLCTLRHHV